MPKPSPFNEQLLIQKNDPLPIAVDSLTRVGGLATAHTTTPHNYLNGDFVTLAGATPPQYNYRAKITVTDPSTFTYPVSSALATPATGTITATYVSDAEGGRALAWRDVATISAEQLTVRQYEKLQMAAVRAPLDYRFRTHARADVTVKMRALWTPQWPPGGAPHTLEIHGITPDGDARQYMLLDMGEVP